MNYGGPVIHNALVPAATRSPSSTEMSDSAATVLMMRRERRGMRERETSKAQMCADDELDFFGRPGRGTVPASSRACLQEAGLAVHPVEPAYGLILVPHVLSWLPEAAHHTPAGASTR